MATGVRRERTKELVLPRRGLTVVAGPECLQVRSKGSAARYTIHRADAIGAQARRHLGGWRVEDVGLLEPFIAPLIFTFRQTAQWTFALMALESSSADLSRQLSHICSGTVATFLHLPGLCPCLADGHRHFSISGMTFPLSVSLNRCGNQSVSEGRPPSGRCLSLRDILSR